MHNFKDLDVWKEAMALTKMIYNVTKTFPSEEKYGLTSQIRRCTVSIPSNIAEGAGKLSNKDFVNFLSIALGSSFELETQFILSVDLGYVVDFDILPQIQKVQRMTYGLRKSLSAPEEITPYNKVN